MFMLVSVSFIVTSTVTMTLNTLPYFQQHHHEENASSNSSTTLRPTTSSSPAAAHNTMTTTPEYDADTTDNPVMAAIETVCVAWFTFEFLIRCVKFALPQSTPAVLFSEAYGSCSVECRV